LTGLLEDSSPRVQAQALRALKLWATPDSLPALVAFAQRQQKAGVSNPVLLDVLGQFREAKAAEAVALQLKNPTLRSRAVQALLKMGPAATRAVLEYLHHPDPGVQKAARGVLRTLKTPAGRQIDQTLADLADSRKPRARAALQYLARLRPDQASRAKVSRALNAPLLDADRGIRDDALRAAKVWGTKENTATLLKLLGTFPQGDTGGNARVIEALAVVRDPKAAPALAQGLTHDDERGLVSKALQAMGPQAETAVLPFLESEDRPARIEACLILAEIGTGKSLPALKAALEAHPYDGVFIKEAEIAAQKIAART
jgi:HEAT repeat protein